MEDNNVASDRVIAELIGMGFEFSQITEAIKSVGPSLDASLEFILNGSNRNIKVASSSGFNSKTLEKKPVNPSNSFARMRQLSLVEQFKSAGRQKRSKNIVDTDVQMEVSDNVKDVLETSTSKCCCEEDDIGPDWEYKVKTLLQKQFGISSLKSFQIEALFAWLAHQDCLVLAATGSGKSLCFQIPAMITGKVVVVISPLISLMHDQCLKLAKHGVSACFLGSGQVDRSVEEKAMKGLYEIIYVCPETLLRLIKPLQGLAENRGIALFAIDEVHCVSKWGHDFRPDYRRLSVLRESFGAKNLKFLKFDIPIMALTATATIRVREDILQSLCMSKDQTKIVITSFFRPNLRFSVKHSRTSSPSSYEKDFREIIDVYTNKKNSGKKHYPNVEDSSENSSTESDGICKNNLEHDSCSENDDEACLSVEFLEDECDFLQDVDDLDVSCGEFHGQSLQTENNIDGFLKTSDIPIKPEERLKLRQKPLENGPTIIYAPTRKETVNISKFLCKFGVKAAAYNAKLPKAHLRQVHKEFHENSVQVVVATIAFGMGIDKLNVRRIIHYGWPQSLEAYYQEAGRAGRDGKLADCILYANLSRTPTLLPNKRSEEQSKQAYKMLSDCFRYGVRTTTCRAATLVQYFGEDFEDDKCLLCDICVNGPPEMQDLKAEADIFLQVIAAHYGIIGFGEDENENVGYSGTRRRKFMENPNIKVFVSKIREQSEKYAASDLLWWRGLARILEDKGLIRESSDMIHVQIKFPELTEKGHEFLCTNSNEPFNVHPEADMVMSQNSKKSYSSFAEWGRGWADPEIRCQRLERKHSSFSSPSRKIRKRKSRKNPRNNLRTSRGRLNAKLSKHT